MEISGCNIAAKTPKVAAKTERTNLNVHPPPVEAKLQNLPLLLVVC